MEEQCKIIYYVISEHYCNLKLISMTTNKEYAEEQKKIRKLKHPEEGIKIFIEV